MPSIKNTSDFLEKEKDEVERSYSIRYGYLLNLKPIMTIWHKDT